MKNKLSALVVLSLWPASANALDQTAAYLDAAVRAACAQIDGVTIGNPSDKTTWSIDFQSGATDQCKAAGRAAMTAFVAPLPGTPMTVSAMQAKIALSRAGLLNQVNTWVNSQNAETQLIWNNAQNFNRNSALLNAAAQALGLTQNQVDQLFITTQGINP